MAADLALVKDQRQRIGQEPDHRQHYQGRGLMDSGMFEVAVCCDCLEDLHIDSPAAATEPIDEHWRNQAKLEIGGVIVGALFCHFLLAFDSVSVNFVNDNTAPIDGTFSFDNSHEAIGDRPIDLGQVPVLHFEILLTVNASGGMLA